MMFIKPLLYINTGYKLRLPVLDCLLTYALLYRQLRNLIARIERCVERVQLRLNYAFTFRALKVASEKMPPVF